MNKFSDKNNPVNVFSKSNQIFTTSLDVAEKFGKRHEHVVKSIEKLMTDVESHICDQYFRVTKREQSNGVKSKTYQITRDGFTLLVMGFTGKKALRWKVKYI